MIRWQKLGGFLGLFALIALLLGSSLTSRAQQATTATSGSSLVSTAATAPVLPNDGLLDPRGAGHAADPFSNVQFDMCQNSVMTQVNSQLFSADNMDTMVEQAKQQALQGAGVGVASMLGASPTGNLLSDLGSGVLARSCPGTLTEVKESTDCSVYKEGGVFKPELMENAITRVRSANMLAACKIRNAQTVAQTTQCFADQFDRLKSDMNDVKKDFDAYISAGQKYVNAIDKLIGRETKREKTLSEKVKTLDNTLTQALKVQDQLIGKGGGDDMTALVNKVRDQQSKEQAFNDKKKQELVKRTTDCFRAGGTKNSSLRSCVDAYNNPVAPKDCLLQIYYDDIIRKTSGGGKNITNSDRTLAGRQKNNFAGTIDLIMSDYAANYPRRGGMAELVKFYQKDFSRYGQAGTRMMVELQACDKDKSDELKYELTTKNGLGAEAEQLSKDANNVSKALGAVCTDAGRAVTNIGKELNITVNSSTDCNYTEVQTNSTTAAPGTSSLQQVDLRTQLTRVQNLKIALDKLVNSQQSTIVIPENGGSVACSGLIGCKQEAETRRKAAEDNVADLKGEGTYKGVECPNGCPGKQTFFKGANSLMKEKLNGIAEQFAARVTAAKSQFEQMKTMLGNNDIDFPGDFSDRKKSSTSNKCTETDRLCDLGGDFGDILADMSGVPKISGRDFDSVKRSAREKQREYTHISKDFNSQMQALRVKAAECQKESDAKQKLASFNKDKWSPIEKNLNECRVIARKDVDDAQIVSDEIERLSGDLQDDCEAIADTEVGSRGCDRLSAKIERGRAACERIIDRQIEKNKAENDRRRKDDPGTGGNANGTKG